MSKQEKLEYYQFISTVILSRLVRNSTGNLVSKASRMKLYKNYLAMSSKGRTDLFQKKIRENEEVLCSTPIEAATRILVK